MKKTGCFIAVFLAAALLAGCSPAAAVPDITPTIVTPAGSAVSTETVPDASPTPAEEPETTCEPTPEPTPSVPAAELTEDAEWDVPGLDGGDIFTDGDYDTCYELSGGDTVTITCDTPIGSLWVIWDEIPGDWTLTGEDETVQCGENDFIHEFVSLETPSNTVTMTLSESAILNNVYIFSQGYTPDWVQIWEPPCEKADMVLFPTHADDEDLFFGGIMPYYAGELGLKVQVVYMTNHWNEQPRPHELLDGLWTAGNTHYPIISPFNDQYADNLDEAISIYGTEDFIEFQVEMLRRFQPSVIICHDEAGEYGHGVHMLNTYCMETAVLAAADKTQYTDSAAEYGVWDTPKMYIHLYGDDPVVMDWNQPLEHFDGMTALEVARAAYKCHTSQQQWAFSVEEEGYGDCRLFGLYRTTVGEDTGKNDLMENIQNRY